MARKSVEKRDAIIDAVREDLHRRSQLGIVKYGTTLEENSAALKARLQHAYEEALDLANYLKWAITKLEKKGAKKTHSRPARDDGSRAKRVPVAVRKR